MVRWPLALALGVAAAVALTATAVIRLRASVEAELTARAQAALAGEATSWAQVVVNGRDLMLSGEAPDETLRALAVTRLERVPGIRSVDAAAAGLLPEAVPYRLSLLRTADRIEVSGNAPSEPERQRMIAALAAVAGDLQPVDRLSPARGMPDADWLAAAAVLYPLAADLGEGEISLEDRTATLRGEARDNAAYDRLMSAPALPAGYTYGNGQISRPVVSPFVWQVRWNEAGATVSGFAPSPEVRDRLSAAVRAEAGDRPVTVTVDLAAGEPEGFASAATAAIEFLGLFASAELSIADGRLTLAGPAATPEAWRTLSAHLAAFAPQGFRVEAHADLPVVRPYTLSATRIGDRVTVTGFSPSPAVTDGIRKAAQSVGVSGPAVVELTSANGAPESFAEAATYAVGLLRHLENGTAQIADDHITLSGLARSGAAMIEFEADVASGMPNGYTIDTGIEPPTVAPYGWAIARDGDSLVLTGYAPNEAVRSAIREAAEAAAGDLAVADRTDLAAGLPEDIDLEEVAAFAVGEVLKLDSGRISLLDNRLSVEGRTGDALAGRSLIEALESQLPDGVVRGTVALERPAPLLARLEKGPDHLRLSATVVDRDARERLKAAADRLFGDLPVELMLSLDTETPVESEAMVRAALEAASRLEEGLVAVDGSTLSIRGRAFTLTGTQRLEADVAALLPQGFAVMADVAAADPLAPLTPAECQDRLTALTPSTRWLFVPETADFAPESVGTMDRLLRIAAACIDAALVIEGHVAPMGEESRALELSRRRAVAVMSALLDGGIVAERLSAEGFGSARPVAEGEGGAADRQNTRIGFRVVPDQAR